MTTKHDWLDKYIIEQADHYNLSTKSKADLFAGAAVYDEMILEGVVEEPPRSNADSKLSDEFGVTDDLEETA